MSESEMRGRPIPDFAPLDPGYGATHGRSPISGEDAAGMFNPGRDNI